MQPKTPASALTRANWRMQASSGSLWPLIRSPVTTARWGWSVERGIDHAGEFGFTEEGAEVNVAELQDAQAIEVGRQAGQRNIDLADVEIGALDESAVAYGGKRRGHERAAGGIEHAAAAGVHVGVQEAAHPGEHLVDRQHAGHGHQVSQRTGAQNAADAGGNAQPARAPWKR